MSDRNNDLQVHIFRGDEGEQVPVTTEKLIVDASVRTLPNLRNDHDEYFNGLKEVVLPYGLERIGDSAFCYCSELPEIRVPSTVRYIDENAFATCRALTKVTFEESASSPTQLTTIGDAGFFCCISLLRVKLPSSVDLLGDSVFFQCSSMMEANLSKTSITVVPRAVFSGCHSLQTASLPNTLESIDSSAFYYCSELLTVVVPSDSNPIRIEQNTFKNCGLLANLALPKGSSAKESSFDSCEQLHRRYGEDSATIVQGLEGRFEINILHGLCYNNAGVTPEALVQNIEEQQKEGVSLVDECGMTPFHILFSTPEPRSELLQILLRQLEHPYKVAHWRDGNDKRPLDYLMSNWNDSQTETLLRPTLQKWVVEPLVNWGAMVWAEAMRTKVQTILDGQDGQLRSMLMDGTYQAFGRYEKMESVSVLELALWKAKLKCRWRSNERGSNKRPALDRLECRCVCGSGVVIPHVTAFVFA